MTWCSCCGHPCEVIEIDEGLGHIEYWGATSIHEYWVEVSDCCQEEVITDPEDW